MKLCSLIIIIIVLNSFSCSSQTWVQKASLPNTTAGYWPISFSIGGKLYVGGGYWNGSILGSFYQYDPATDIWTAKANLPQALYAAAYFVINNLGYVVCGNSPSGILANVYMYDPGTDTWHVKNNFPGTPRYKTEGFSLNGKGYMYAGFIGGSSVLNDMWEYDPSGDSWTQKSNSPGQVRNSPAALILNNQAYVGLGSDVNGNSYYTDFYRYDPVTDTYTPRANALVGRNGAAHFVIGSIGYVGLGLIGFNNSPPVARDFNTYDPASDSWAVVNNFGGRSRAWTFNETVGGKPYVGAGADLVDGLFNTDNWTWDICRLNINLGRDTTLCTGQTFTLRDTTTGATFLWSTGATASSISVSASGTYWVRTTRGTCIGSDTIVVSFTGPVGAFNLGDDTTYCGSFTRILSTGEVNTHWSTGAVAPSIVVSSPGHYSAMISNACGSSTDTIILSQNPLPVVNLGKDTNLCPGQSLQLSALTASATYSWQDGTMAPTFDVTASGTYWVNVTVNNCSARDSILIAYITPQSFHLGADTTYCGVFSRVLTAGIANTQWNTGEVGTSITVSSPGTYWGQLIACSDTLSDSITISQKPVPLVNIGNDTTLCTGDTLVLSAAAANATYVWQNGITNTSIKVTGTGLYWVDVMVDGCDKRDSISIAYITLPDAVYLGADTTICQDSSLVLSAYEPFAHYNWSTGDTNNSIAVRSSGSYTVTVSNQCGSTTASESITVQQCSCVIIFPTAFSPNNDGKNDTYEVLTKCPVKNYKMDIYNRWGQLIFTCDDITDKWDGAYRSKAQPEGVYTWYVQYTDPYTNERRSLCGNLSLFR